MTWVNWLAIGISAVAIAINVWTMILQRRIERRAKRLRGGT